MLPPTGRHGKPEIVDHARRIGTFEISTIPEEDEAKFDVQALLRAGVDNAVEEEFAFPPLSADGSP